MNPSWRSDDSGPLPAVRTTADGHLGLTRQDLFAEPLPDLDQQLSAELSGASWAVVSFVPEDAAWCDWIYRCLNGYPLSVSLIGRITPHGFPRPDCLSVFPDRQDPTYEEQAAQALESSAYLIVVCSPHSAQAAAVEESIRVFKKSGGEERIIALVVDGLPDAQPGERLRAPGFDWLPAWLRWRCDEKGFCPADRSEPRVIEARRGLASLRQVRDALLTAVVDLEAGELQDLGIFNRPLPELPAVPTVVLSTMPQSFFTDIPVPTPEPSVQRDAAFMIGTALVLIAVAVIFGIKSFRELSAEEPQSALAVGPRATPRIVRPAALPPMPVSEPRAEAEPVAPVASVAAMLAASAPPAPAPVAAPRPNIPQFAPSQVFALTRVQPTPPAQAVAAPPVSIADDAVLLDEVKTLERRGDEIMAERRTEDALDLYSTALGSAIEYAARKGANPAAKDQVVMLQRKLGMLQVQNASTAEARTTYQQARKTLLQLKQQGIWSRERAKTLDEMESRLLSLPRD